MIYVVSSIKFVDELENVWEGGENRRRILLNEWAIDL